ncbi:MAG: hypothetical protein HY053_04970 [Proteobacteria bacterium]|nr:hypothetical protein [Pseudomonadota bacterium]
MMRLFIASFLFALLASTAFAENLPPNTLPPSAFSMQPETSTDLPPPAKPKAKPKAKKAKSPSSPLAALAGKKDGAQFIDVTADESLEWHEKESLYIARGHAVATRGTMKVEADVLKAYNRKNPDGSSQVWRLTAEGHVKIIDSNHEATGDLGEYDIDSRRATLTGGNLRFTSGADIVTASESFEYYEAEGRIIARGNVKAHREGRRVRADEMTAFLANNKTGGQDIDHMEARGHVQITTDQDAALCDRALYNLSQDSATLTGNVRITRGGNQLHGDKVEANFKTGQSRLINTGGGRVSALIAGSPGGADNGKPGGALAAPLFNPAKR